jgi:hypothetical protein
MDTRAATAELSRPSGERELVCPRCDHPHRLEAGALAALVLAAVADSTGLRVPPVTLASAPKWVETPCRPSGRLWQRVTPPAT